MIEPGYLGINPANIKRTLFPGPATNSTGTQYFSISNIVEWLTLQVFQLCYLKICHECVELYR